MQLRQEREAEGVGVRVTTITNPVRFSFAVQACRWDQVESFNIHHPVIMFQLFEVCCLGFKGIPCVFFSGRPESASPTGCGCQVYRQFPSVVGGVAKFL